MPQHGQEETRQQEERVDQAVAVDPGQAELRRAVVDRKLPTHSRSGTVSSITPARAMAHGRRRLSGL